MRFLQNSLETIRYDAALQRALGAVAKRYGSHQLLTFVNVVGPSASGGVEANFNVDYETSRAVIPNWDASVNYTASKYISAWKQAIDTHLLLFPRARVGMATHDQPGDFGLEKGNVVQYTVNEKMATARSIRDHLVQKSAQPDVVSGGAAPPRPTSVIRDCDGSNDTTHVWGVPNVSVGGPNDLPPPSNFARLVWEVREKVNVGFEQGGIVPRKDSGADTHISIGFILLCLECVLLL
jgi:hypothetical protein